VFRNIASFIDRLDYHNLRYGVPMKRRSKSKVGQWPNMLDSTLKEISSELIRARKKHPHQGGNITMVQISARALVEELGWHRDKKMTASQVYARAAQLAAMAIRVLEEGSAGYPYTGTTSAPAFKLEPTENE
jgi:hypothetical protein